MTDVPPPAPCRNVELKARVESLARVRAIAAQLATERLEDQRQIDTYFHCRRGRLKLREINGQRAELIWYERPDQSDPKPCHYCRVPVAQPDEVKRALQSLLGLRAIVDKRREIYLHHNVRIHLDEVAGLGTFLEFEAVLQPDEPVDVGQTQVQRLREQFGLEASDLLSGSYVDL
jgi:predicted adenylyl cyclase CyaB